jgi:lysophospholipase L1-like esterase
MAEYRNPQRLKHRDNLTIITIGDSTAAANPAYGHFADTDDGRMTPWPELVSHTFSRHKFYNRAVNGDTFEMMRDRFYRDVFSLDPDIVIIAGGANNCWDTSKPVTGIAGIDMANQCMSNGVYVMDVMYMPISRDWVERMPCLATTSPQYREQVWRNGWIMQTAVHEWCGQHGIPAVNVSGVFADRQRLHTEWLRRDVMHPNQTGYNIIANMVSDQLRNVLRTVAR